MQRIVFLLAGSIFLVAGLVLALRQNDARPTLSTTEPLTLFCAASNRAAVEAVIAEYEKECQRKVNVQYGPSQSLLTSLEISGACDLFLPADNSFVELAKQKSLVAEAIPLADMQVVLAVAKGNPHNIHSIEDVLAKGKDKLRLVQANPDAAAVGMITRRVLKERDLWDKLNEATTAFRVTVNDAANDVAIGSADVAIVYDVVAHTMPKLEVVTAPELASARSRVEIAVSQSSKQPTAALHFARFISARDRGLKQYAEQGFQVVRGDKWSDKPELSIFAGSMLRPAIEKTIIAFEQREGVRVSRVYNGCGILVAEMKAGQHPDAYFACDKEFMNSLPDLFPEPVDVSQNELVILVQKGNPHDIKSLRDLTKQGLRVGIGHEKQCAMGWLTQNTLREGGIQKEVMANVTVQTPTGDMLVNQMRTGSLDAAVVYLSNAAGAGDYLDAVRIVGLPCSIAIQPFAVAVDSPNSQLASRLFERIRSTDSKRNFLAEGFRWSADLPASALPTGSGTTRKPSSAQTASENAAKENAAQDGATQDEAASSQGDANTAKPRSTEATGAAASSASSSATSSTTAERE